MVATRQMGKMPVEAGSERGSFKEKGSGPGTPVPTPEYLLDQNTKPHAMLMFYVGTRALKPGSPGENVSSPYSEA